MPLAHFFNTKTIQFIEARLSLTRMPSAVTPTHSHINTYYCHYTSCADQSRWKRIAF